MISSSIMSTYLFRKKCFYIRRVPLKVASTFLQGLPGGITDSSYSRGRKLWFLEQYFFHSQIGFTEKPSRRLFVLKLAKSNLFLTAKQKHKFNLTSSHLPQVVFLSVSLKDVCRSQAKTSPKTKRFRNTPNKKCWKGLLQSAFILQRRQRLLKDRTSDSLRLTKYVITEKVHMTTRFCLFWLSSRTVLESRLTLRKARLHTFLSLVSCSLFFIWGVCDPSSS